MQVSSAPTIYMLWISVTVSSIMAHPSHPLREFIRVNHMHTLPESPGAIICATRLSAFGVIYAITIPAYSPSCCLNRIFPFRIRAIVAAFRDEVYRETCAVAIMAILQSGGDTHV